MSPTNVTASAAGPAARDRPRKRPRIDLAAFLRLTELADYFIPFTIRAVCELDIADRLIDGPRSADELAAQAGVHGPSLYRALRALASKGVFTETEPGVFALTPLADLLRSDHPFSMKDSYHLMAADVEAWSNIDYSLRTGEPAFDHVHGMRLWDWLAKHPDEGERFHRGMAAMTRSEIRAVASTYDWTTVSTVVDVGGGNGAFLAGLLARHGNLRGILFDLPEVVAPAAGVLGDAGVADRCEIVAGSFFADVPAGADAYVLKRIVYGWDDEHAEAILRRVRAGMRPDSRIILAEPTAGPGTSEVEAMLDVVMLVVDGGRARTADELRALMEQADLRLLRVVPTMTFPIVEGRAA